jgi:basic amino acid/polyamine antiporter, APA family
MQLSRVVGLPGAIGMGLGSIVGTGVFVSLGLAAGIAGPAVVIAVGLAALVATFNGLSAAQLAASHPVSGGTYEYGYRYLHPSLGFTAGFMFLCAKSASAATAALGLAGYALDRGGWARIGLAAGTVVAVTVLVAGGVKRSNVVNAVIVAITMVALGAFVAVGAGEVDRAHFDGLGEVGARDLLHATALMFVAFTGYGRIATLGEEVHDPARTIPRAIVFTLAITAVLYIAVAAVAVGVLGAADLGAITRATAAPLEAAAPSSIRWLVAIGAITAMLGVLLNLVLGLSRVVLAMGRRRDLPSRLATVTGGTPRLAVLAVGAAIAALTLIGSVKTTWSFSAFTVLVYYAITNLAALRLPAEHRRFPRAVPALGLLSCLALAFWVEPRVWLTGGALIAAGLAYHAIVRKSRRGTAAPR